MNGVEYRVINEQLNWVFEIMKVEVLVDQENIESNLTEEFINLILESTGS